MTRDRYGEEVEDQPCPHGCRNGWLSAPDADVAVACRCRWQRIHNTNNDFAVREPSARAAAAIRAEENR
ncbi:hypothetical protein ATM97_27895 [Nocardia sp. MH4]|uniref:hypothetical protein n=1 Tax=Nocardia sp. MH4 TaxID=1768677 RepID=UPI001C4ECAC4|nr:hypothetical protein [Nocardia sp. MH4]MBW0275028.1 hypothetical protein [Nocardia sp. MH4]